jgi:hypothetical protein
VINSIVKVLNNQDRTYSQKVIAPDTVWLDEDGHHLAAMIWMNDEGARQLKGYQHALLQKEW